MSGADLKIELAQLRELVAALEAIIGTFDDTRGASGAVADAAGDEQLAARVRGFATSWRSTQSDLGESVKALRTQLEEMTRGFTEVDSQLSSALAGGRT